MSINDNPLSLGDTVQDRQGNQYAITVLYGPDYLMVRNLVTKEVTRIPRAEVTKTSEESR